MTLEALEAEYDRLSKLGMELGSLSKALFKQKYDLYRSIQEACPHLTIRPHTEYDEYGSECRVFKCQRCGRYK